MWHALCSVLETKTTKREPQVRTCTRGNTTRKTAYIRLGQAALHWPKNDVTWHVRTPWNPKTPSMPDQRLLLALPTLLPNQTSQLPCRLFVTAVLDLCIPPPPRAINMGRTARPACTRSCAAHYLRSPQTSALLVPGCYHTSSGLMPAPASTAAREAAAATRATTTPTASASMPATAEP